MNFFPDHGDRDEDRIYCRTCITWHNIADVEQEKDPTSLHAKIKQAILESAPGFTDQDYSTYEDQAHGISYDVMKVLKDNKE